MAANQPRQESEAVRRKAARIKQDSIESTRSTSSEHRILYVALIFFLVFSCGLSIALISATGDIDSQDDRIAALDRTLEAMSDDDLATATAAALEMLTLTPQAEILTPTPSPTATVTPSPTNQFSVPGYRLENDSNYPVENSDVDIYFETHDARRGEIETLDQVFDITRTDTSILSNMLSAFGLNETTFRAQLPNIDALAPWPELQQLIAESDQLHRQLSPIQERGINVDPAYPETSGLNMTTQDLEILTSDESLLNFVNLWTAESWAQASNLRINDQAPDSQVSLVPVDGLLTQALQNQDLGLGTISLDNEHKYFFAVPQIQNLWPTLKVTSIDYLADESNGRIDIQKLHEASDIFSNLVTNYLLGEGQGEELTFVFSESSLDRTFSSTANAAPAFINVREIYDGPVESNGQQSPFGDPVDQNTRDRCVVVDPNIVREDEDPTEVSWWENLLPSNNMVTLSISIAPDERLSDATWLSNASAAEIAQAMFENAVVLSGEASAEYLGSPDREATSNPDSTVNRGITFFLRGCGAAPIVPQAPGPGEVPGQPGEQPEISPTPPGTEEKAPEGQPATPVPTDITGPQPTIVPTKVLPTPAATPPAF